MRRTAMVCLGLGLLTLTACANDDVPAPGFPGTIPHATWSDDRSWAARIDGDYQMLFVTTTGSSTCPHIIDSAHYDVEARILTVAAHQHKPSGGMCTMDIQPHTSFLHLQEPVAPDTDVTVELEDFYTTVTLTPDTSVHESFGVPATP